jgi:uncharacterized membrane protein
MAASSLQKAIALQQQYKFTPLSLALPSRRQPSSPILPASMIRLVSPLSCVASLRLVRFTCVTELLPEATRAQSGVIDHSHALALHRATFRASDRHFGLVCVDLRKHLAQQPLSCVYPNTKALDRLARSVPSQDHHHPFRDVASNHCAHRQQSLATHQQSLEPGDRAGVRNGWKSPKDLPDMTAPTPTLPPPQPKNLSNALKRNIEALEARRQQEAVCATRQERLAEAITTFTGSMRFVYLHLALYGAWILVNIGVIPELPKFDPTFVILAMEASVEAIFLSTFVLISQNRTAAAADKRADLDLQINLLAEHELTKLTEVVTAIAARLDVQPGIEIEEVKKDVAPEAVLDELDARQDSG